MSGDRGTGKSCWAIFRLRFDYLVLRITIIRICGRRIHIFPLIHVMRFCKSCRCPVWQTYRDISDQSGVKESKIINKPKFVNNIFHLIVMVPRNDPRSFKVRTRLSACGFETTVCAQPWWTAMPVSCVEPIILLFIAPFNSGSAPTEPRGRKSNIWLNRSSHFSTGILRILILLLSAQYLLLFEDVSPTAFGRCNPNDCVDQYR